MPRFTLLLTVLAPLAMLPALAAPPPLCGLEAPDALAAWSVSAAKIELSTEFAPGGRHSLKVTFEPNRDWPTVSPKKLATSDWSAYASFQCTVYNPQDFGINLDMDFNAPDGSQYKPAFGLAPREFTQVVVPIQGMKAGSWPSGWCGKAIDPAHVVGVNLFTDRSNVARTIYISDLKLVPPLPPRRR